MDAKGTVRTVALVDVMPWPNLNPRTRFDKAATKELAASIEEVGLVQPIIVKELQGGAHSEGAAGRTYWIVAGERRYRASLEAKGVDTIDVLVRDLDERTAHRIAGIENIDRDNLTAIEEARWLKRELELNSGLTQTKLAKELGRSQAWAANRLRLLELPPAIQKMIDEGVVAPAMARDVLLRFVKLDQEVLPKLWKAIVKAIKAEAKDSSPVLLRDLRDAAAYGMDAAGWDRVDAGSMWTGQRYVTIPQEELDTFVEQHAGQCVRFPYAHGGGDALWTAAPKEWKARVDMIVEQAKETQTSRGVDKSKLQKPRLGPKRKPMTRDALKDKFGYENVLDFDSIVDPSKLDPKSVVALEPRSYDDFEAGERFAYVGSNTNSLKGQRTRMRNPIRADEQGKALRARMDTATEELTPTKVGLGLIELALGSHEYHELVVGLLEADGVELPEDGLSKWAAKNQLEGVKVPAATVKRVLAALAHIELDPAPAYHIGQDVDKKADARVKRESKKARTAWLKEHGFKEGA